MLSEGNAKKPTEAFYEREHLRRMARKLGLHLVKSNRREPQQEISFSRTSQVVEPRLGAAAGSAAQAVQPRADLDKCG
ncbi:MAG TPA: hypothetical protein VGL22_19020 [Terracidiphilus sp.]